MSLKYTKFHASAASCCSWNTSEQQCAHFPRFLSFLFSFSFFCFALSRRVQLYYELGRGRRSVKQVSLGFLLCSSHRLGQSRFLLCSSHRLGQSWFLLCSSHRLGQFWFLSCSSHRLCSSLSGMVGGTRTLLASCRRLPGARHVKAVPVKSVPED